MDKALSEPLRPKQYKRASWLSQNKSLFGPEVNFNATIESQQAVAMKKSIHTNVLVPFELSFEDYGIPNCDLLLAICDIENSTLVREKLSH